MTASIVLAVAMILVSIGTLTWFAPIMIFPFILGAARLHPTIDRLWPLADEKGPI
jgi:flagellar biosynthesis protein FlhB